MIKNAFIPNFFRLYNMIWRMGIPFLKQNRRLKAGFHKRLSTAHHTPADIWIQAASAGEAYLCVCILKALRPKKQINILATATTDQGRDILTSALQPETLDSRISLRIDWFPFDSPETVQKTVRAVRPRVMVLLETEIWPALLYYLKQNRTKILIANARLSKKSFSRYLKTKFLWRHLAPDEVLATSDRDASRYGRIFETARVSTIPNIKFESIARKKGDETARDRIKAILPHGKPLTILASIRRQEEKEALGIIETVLSKVPDQVVAVFPRHMHRLPAWEKHLKKKGCHFIRRSGITSSDACPDIILWDTFGELRSAYEFASVVFVGASLKPLGGQNFLEPLVQGAVTITGPFYDDFAWAGEDLFRKGLVLKKKKETVADTIVNALKNPANRADKITAAQQYIQSRQGGTQEVCKKILQML